MNDAPRSLPGKNVENPHSIYISEEDITIPMKVKGAMSGFDTRIPTHHKLNTCAHAVLNNGPRWDPSISDIVKQDKNHGKKYCDDMGPRMPRGVCQLFAMYRWTEVSYVLSSVLKNLQDGYFWKI